MPWDAPHAEWRTLAKPVWHAVQIACVSNTSNGVRHAPQTHDALVIKERIVKGMGTRGTA